MAGTWRKNPRCQIFGLNHQPQSVMTTGTSDWLAAAAISGRL